MKKIIGMLLAMVIVANANDLQYGLAVQAAQKGEWEHAQKKMQSLLIHASERPDLLYDAGIVEAKLNNHQQAEHYFLMAAEHAKQQLQEQAYFNAGNMAVEQKEYERAVSAYQKVISLNPDNKCAHHNLEKVKELMKQEQKKQEREKEKKEQEKKQQEKNQEQNKQNQQQQEKGKQENQSSSSKSSDKGNEGSQEGQNDSSQSRTEQQNKDKQQQSDFKKQQRDPQDDPKKNPHDKQQTQKDAEQPNHDEKSSQVNRSSNKDNHTKNNANKQTPMRGKGDQKETNERTQEIDNLLELIQQHDDDIQKQFGHDVIQRQLGGTRYEDGW